MLLLLTDLERLGHTALQEFGHELTRNGGAGQVDFERPAHRLEAKLEQLYAVAATLAQREASLEGVATIWGRMVEICDSMAQALASVQEERAQLSESYDRILDIRNACEENRALHA